MSPLHSAIWCSPLSSVCMQFLPGTALRRKTGLVSCKKSLPLSYFISLSDLRTETYSVQWDLVVTHAVCIYSCIIEQNFPCRKTRILRTQHYTNCNEKLMGKKEWGNLLFPDFQGFLFFLKCSLIFLEFSTDLQYNSSSKALYMEKSN